MNNTWLDGKMDACASRWLPSSSWRYRGSKACSCALSNTTSTRCTAWKPSSITCVRVILTRPPRSCITPCLPPTRLWVSMALSTWRFSAPSTFLVPYLIKKPVKHPKLVVTNFWLQIIGVMTCWASGFFGLFNALYTLVLAAAGFF